MAHLESNINAKIREQQQEIQSQMSVVNANADKIREAKRQVLCDFGDEMREMQAHLAERESQIAARADRLIEVENQLMLGHWVLNCRQ